jgi:hypothetical protein
MEEQIPSSESQTTPKYSIFGGAIGYDSPSDFEQFVSTMNQTNALYMLITAVNYAQSKGVYSIPEAEMLAASIKSFVKKKVEEPTKEQTDEPNN